MSIRSFKIRRMVFSALYIALAIFAIVQSVLSGEQSAEVSEQFTSAASSPFIGGEVSEVTVFDKTITFAEFVGIFRKAFGHFGLFAAMGLCGFFALFHSIETKNVVIIDLLATFSVAVITEIIQAAVPTRVGLFADAVLDMQGAIAAVAVISAVISVRSRVKHGVRRRYLFYCISIPAVLFSALFLIVGTDNLPAKCCFIVYLVICALSISTIAVANFKK